MSLRSIMGISTPKTVGQLEERQARRLQAGQQAALRSRRHPAKLERAAHRIMYAIGHHRWTVAVNAPVNLDVYASERDYQAACWRVAMAAMQNFYLTAVKRKDVQL